jgi:hypothetical protein
LEKGKDLQGVEIPLKVETKEDRNRTSKAAENPTARTEDIQHDDAAAKVAAEMGMTFVFPGRALGTRAMRRTTAPENRCRPRNGAGLSNRNSIAAVGTLMASQRKSHCPAGSGAVVNK